MFYCEILLNRSQTFIALMQSFISVIRLIDALLRISFVVVVVINKVMDALLIPVLLW